MSFTEEHYAELDVLMLYNLSTSQEGIKIHKTADKKIIAAAKSLFDNGFITLVDGGYLTTLGREAAEHVQSLYTMLKINK